MAMIKSKKDHDAINFARADIYKYEGQQADYVFYGHFDSNYLRSQTATYSVCYERDIVTNEIPEQPSFYFWEMSNIRKVAIADNSPHHEWNHQLLRDGFKVKEGETVKMEHGFSDFDNAQYAARLKKLKLKEKKKEAKEKRDAEETTEEQEAKDKVHAERQEEKKAK